ncbi:LysR family transcriptional regulator [Advenella kashmirensis W13003]|uniref:LysR family transcriptional regulator n=1 Tax=Advenella kashmirensis W13003 TaxID=1424334 RepID=V8QX73_9BURK|nr:transcriptional regulator GcvA [Advenella kashmirensis]ETF03963.1 LysR family transcriptional regulator [Advenella kashmirensis W13003]
MLRRLPPLNALRVFDAAAGCDSLTQAANNLCISQGAVSRHIHLLEDWLGLQLFVRQRHGISLTADGIVYQRIVADALAQIELGSRQLQRRTDTKRLRIKLPPTFAIKWLVPRLAHFHARHPELDVQITTSHQHADFNREDIDLSIQARPHASEALNEEELFGEILVPVCAPSLLQGQPPLRQPADLANHVLLCSLNRPDDWPAWLQAAGQAQIDGNLGLKFENAALAYQAAANGLGVTIGLAAFIEQDLNAGVLVAPFDLRVRTDGGYFMAHASDRPVPEGVQLFQAWIREEAASMQQG